jgi:hypothetical protein
MWCGVHTFDLSATDMQHIVPLGCGCVQSWGIEGAGTLQRAGNQTTQANHALPYDSQPL